MKTMKASEFQAKFLDLVDEAQETGEEIVVTKNGKTVGTFIATRKKRGGLFFGMGKGKIEIVGDIAGPIVPLWTIDAGPSKLPKSRKRTVAKKSAK